MSIEIGVFEAKTRLSELVEQIARGGESVLITKRGKPAARLVPVDASGSTVADVLALLLAARQASRAGDRTLRELIDDGRGR